MEPGRSRKFLQEELRALGAKENQINSKVVDYMLTALTNNRSFLESFDIQQEIDERKRELRGIEHDITEKRRYMAELGEYHTSTLNLISERKQSLEKYIDDFNNSLNNTETPEGRDRLRAAQYFVNSVKIESKYDNTAFIGGLAAILCGAQIDPVGELRKINPRLFISELEPMPIPAVKAEEQEDTE